VTGDPLLNDVAFTQDSGYLAVPGATYDVVIAADGTSTPAVPGTAGLELTAGSITTALAIGADVSSLAPLLLDDKR
jgi:2-keto-3-deoxy-6-phosphogluconate aldolase